MKRDRILDAWRGVGILFVIAHHMFYFHWSVFRDFYVAHATSGIVEELLWRLDQWLVWFSERSGPLGVKLFFVVSGYIITRLMLEEESRRGSLSLYAFYVRRVFRILPAYLAYIALVAGFAALGWAPLSGADAAGALAFACNTGVSCGWQVIHTWTLAVEMQFYLLWPLVFVVLPNRLRENFLAGLIGVLITLSAFEVGLAGGWIDNGASFACIALGALYAVSGNFREFLERRGPAALVLGILAVVLLWFFHWSVAAHVLYRALIPLVVVTAVFFAYRFNTLAESRAVIALSYVGLISYSLYLWQQVFAAPSDNYTAPSFLQYPILMFVFAVLSYFFIEKPFIRFGKRLLRRGAPPETPTEREARGL